MENKMNKYGVEKVLAVLAVAFACVCMWGCGLFDEEVTTTINEKRSDGRIIAILDDSLAFVFNGRRWDEFSESCDYWNNCEYGFVNQGLFLVNYRTKQRPYWGDTIEGVLYTASGLAYDSTIFVYRDDDKFGFWKLGEFPDIRKKMIWSDECYESENIKNVRSWKNGKILLKMEWLENCPYAVIDTATGKVKKLEFTGDYAWLEGCDDITYVDGEVVCLHQRGDRLCEIDFEKKEGVVDSLIKSEWMMGNSPYFMGNAARLPVYTWDKEDPAHNLGDRIVLFDKNGFKQGNPVTWLKYNSFADSTGFSISYSSDDLIIIK